MTFNNLIKKAKSILFQLAIQLPGIKEFLTWAELFNGCIVLGSSGGGKTSGPFYYFLRAVLSHPIVPGTMITTTKTDDRRKLESIIRECGRGDNLVILSADSEYTVNPIHYVLFNLRKGKVNYDDALELLMEIFLMGENYSPDGVSGDTERFWNKSLRKNLKRLMMLMVLAEVPVTMANMRKALIDSFSTEEVERYRALWSEIQNGKGSMQQSAIEEYVQWREENYFLYCFDRADSRENLSIEQQEIIQLVGDYFFKVWPRISEKTRAIVEESALGLMEPFITGILATHFSGEMSPELCPERCFKEGAIILVDLPIKSEGIASVYGNGAMKKIFQLCIESRDVDMEENPRPTALFIDEFHYQVIPHSDDRFQSSCRSKMCATFYATQSISNIEIAMGKEAAQAKTKSFIGNLGIQVFCSNNNRDSNLHAADLIGKTYIKKDSSSYDSNDRSSRSTREELVYSVPPEHFASALRCGGPDNNFKVDTIISVRGKKWSTGEPFREVTFDQRQSQVSFWQKIKIFFQ